MQETKLEEDAIFAILYQVVNGLAYLHRSGRMHRYASLSSVPLIK